MLQELVVSITIGFAALFALIGGPLNSVFGRRYVILLASFVFMGGSGLLAAAMNKEMLLVGRAVVGVGIGKLMCPVVFFVILLKLPLVCNCTKLNIQSIFFSLNTKITCPQKREMKYQDALLWQSGKV